MPMMKPRMTQPQKKVRVIRSVGLWEGPIAERDDRVAGEALIEAHGSEHAAQKGGDERSLLRHGLISLDACSIRAKQRISGLAK